MKKFIIGISISIIAIAAGVFVYRYQIIQYSADKIIRSCLPEYVRVEKIVFDAKSGKIVLAGFRILNPPNFSGNYLLEISEVSAGYRMKGKSLGEGFEILDPVFKRPILNIERLDDGRLNLSEMQGVLSKKTGSAPGSSEKSNTATPVSGISAPRLITLPDKYLFRDGKVIFVDRFRFSKPNMLTFENVNAEVSVRFDDTSSRLLSLASVGEGNVNGKAQETVKWDIGLDPAAPRLTMSSRFNVSGVEITPFEPYYDKYSPLVFRSGLFSGTLIFDFNNGNIGSSNEVHLKDFQFYVKPGYENAQFWDTTVPDLVKYFTSPYGEVVFDFKIKGEMQNPQFYLGPISKRALASMAVDKISSAIESMSKAQGAEGGSKSDLEKAKEYIDLFKGLVNKK